MAAAAAAAAATATRFFNLVLHLRRWDFRAETLPIRLAKHRNDSIFNWC